MTMQAVHTALWSTYLGFRDPDLIERFASSDRPFTNAQALTRLNDHMRRGADGRLVSLDVLGLAAWNLVGQYVSEEPNILLEHLVQGTLGMDCARARQQYLERDRATLPPDQRFNRIVDSKWSSEDDGRFAKGTLEFTVRRPFEELLGILDPRSWLEARLFWRDLMVKRLRYGEADEIDDPDPDLMPRDYGWRAKGVMVLALPGGKHSPAKCLKGLFDADRTIGARESRIDYQLVAGTVEAPLVCNGCLSLEKMEGQPGSTRVRGQKRVDFPAGDLERFRTQTLAYWIQSETLALALCEKKLPDELAAPAPKPPSASGAAKKKSKKKKKSSKKKGKKKKAKKKHRRAAGEARSKRLGGSRKHEKASARPVRKRSVRKRSSKR